MSASVCGVAICAGFTCETKDLDSANAGCCDVRGVSSKQFSCTTCDEMTSCCERYEYCVSCCMSPQQTGTHVDLVQQKAFAQYSDVSMRARAGPLNDPYTLCAATCRTNSRSVVHENAYKHASHHCYYLHAPPLDARLHRGIFDFAHPVRRRK